MKLLYFPAYGVKVSIASYAPRVSIISKLINTCTSIIQHLYHERVKYASKSLFVNGLLSYPGIYPNVYIASYVIPGTYAAAVAKCSQV
jgi:hypothetical protein